MIEVESLCKYFGPVKAVDDISFSVGKGEIVGFLGPNGAGKTTAMKVLTCFHSPTAGNATVNGHNVEENPLGVRASIGYLPENNPLYLEMGVIEYLCFLASIHGIAPAKRKSRIDDIIEITSLQSMAHKDIGQLSRGFRQRVGLAQALIHDPPVLILDEPTSGLDPIQIQEIRGLIRKVGTEKTVIFSTHILPEAQFVSDRILIISDGKIVGEGTPDELTALAEGEAITYIGIKGDANDARLAVENAAPGSKLDTLPGTPETARFRLTTGSNAKLSERIFDAVVASGLKLVEIHEERASLEDVFNKLTRQPEDDVAQKEGEA
ncbi:ATP-binding cassette domain-containing protein [bacterium]|nr:ATP-binding cassette domain-containing protein [bacterium]